MEKMETQRNSRVVDATPFFYGWVVLTVGALGSLMMGPSQTFTISLFVAPLVRDLGVSQSTIALLYGVATLVASLLLPLTGRLVDRFGPRLLMVAVSIGLGLVTIGMSRVTGLVTLMAGLLLLRFFGFGSMQLVSNNAIAQWFVQRRGFAMGLYNQSLSVSLVFFPWFAGILIANTGWRNAWVVMGSMVIVVLVPISWLLLRDRPEFYGLQPDGGTVEGDGSFRGPVAEENWTLEEARGTAAFWVFVAAFATMTMIFSSLAFHQVSLFAEQGLGQRAAVRSFQMVALISVFSNLLVGKLIDSVSARLLMACTLATLVVLLFSVQRITTFNQALLYGAVTGLGTGSYRVLDASIWPKYFGRRYLGSIKGVTLIGTLGGTALGPYPLGLSADLLGSFGPVLNALVALPLILGVAVYFGIKRPQKC